MSCDHDAAGFDNGMIACMKCFHVLTVEEFRLWLDTTSRIACYPWGRLSCPPKPELLGGPSND
jgi:hypothetical protein